MDSTNSMVRLAINKSLIKEYTTDEHPRVVYLKNGTEFQIQVFNPTQRTVGAHISINGTSLSNMLILKPGERVWLERYFDVAKKFLFETYQVDDSPEVRTAIAQNGKIEIKFYRELEPISISIPPISVNYRQPNYINNIIPQDVYYCNNNTVDTASCTLKGSSSYDSFETTISCSDIDISPKSRSAEKTSLSLETGRIEKGNYSSQKFETTNVNLASYPFATETIFILPESRQPITSDMLSKKYCPYCGKKISPKFKFCPSCGKKV